MTLQTALYCYPTPGHTRRNRKINRNTPGEESRNWGLSSESGLCTFPYRLRLIIILVFYLHPALPCNLARLSLLRTRE